MKNTLYSYDNQYRLVGSLSEETDSKDVDFLRRGLPEEVFALHRRDTFNLRQPAVAARRPSVPQHPGNQDAYQSGVAFQENLPRNVVDITEMHPRDSGIKRINSSYVSRSACQGRLINRQMTLPKLLQYDYHVLQEYDESGEDMKDFEELSQILSFIANEKMVSIEPQIMQGDEQVHHKIIRIGLILSGGPAPGGHNVIAGAFDYLTLRNSQSQLIGFLGGIDGFLNQRHEAVTPQKMDQFRNLGGFNMLWSGRGRINGTEDLDKAVACIKELQLDGLIVVGGDGSNSNAALLSNHLAKVYVEGELRKPCCVVGVPKTVDGDVKSKNIEISFGFETAALTYSELIGNLCTDASSTQYTYHFIRIMGRSASHLALECGMQTHPNILLIGEEVERNQTPLCEIVDYIVDVMHQRSKMGKTYGVVLIPEGLIEFIPEMRILIEEINEILTNSPNSITTLDPCLLKRSRSTWEFLPESIQEQLLMDREATGYIMLAKIATERLLLMLVESRIAAKKLDHLKSLTFMTHYFGYEGRCAIPSSFDASYCYALGYNASVLISNGRNGYISAIRNLKAPLEDWIPVGLPFLHVMHMLENSKGRYPAIRKTLLELDGYMFKTFEQVRDIWAFEDLYRSPGPIQLYNNNDTRCFSLTLPTVEDLTTSTPRGSVKKRFLIAKHLECLSPFQRERLEAIPEVPEICHDLKARLRKFKKVLNPDQYTHSQIIINYPHMATASGFDLFEVFTDSHSGPERPKLNLRVGVVMLSKQAPGALNVFWGVYERIKLVGGVVLAFNGAQGLIDCDYIELCDTDFDYFKNQGGLELVHRSRVAYFYNMQNWGLARGTCEKLQLDGLVILGDEGAMTQASLLTEHFMSSNCSTSIICVPVVSSNGLGGPLIESCVGFDSNARLYSALVGNVLTDAVSMPKYWHFVKILGRYPSLEVLECALQTHPNFVIIAEEYGAADKTLFDVVQDIADAVCKRAEMGYNFGTVLIPDHLVLHLPTTRNMLTELRKIIREATAQGKRDEAIDHLTRYGEVDGIQSEWIDKMIPWSLAVFKSLPNYIRKELLSLNSAEVALERLDIEIMLAKMVKEELNLRKQRGEYRGNYVAVTHYFGYQGRCSTPSEFDCSLAYAYGCVAAMAVESGLTGYCCSIRGLCGSVEDWMLFAIPLTCLMKIAPNVLELLHIPYNFAKGDLPIIPSATVELTSKAFKKFRVARNQWLVEDLFVNPGPMQFDGTVATQSMVLINEHAEYYHMLRSVELFARTLQNSCKFGVSEEFLHHVFVQLWGLIKVTQSPGELLELAKWITTANISRNSLDSLTF
ncbi:bifunctional Pyrophosphate-dependent phosphofructokinase PfpB/ATP-dependent 6-phosphofructokinase/Phosphofructokinase superfamily/Phosphofructokinase domain [Babesia duncani]|uniref:Probable ATP-dependent 6-phosphofructokinase n=1 Tax=Babesia duncani TaxID=323732 RepID=A0AAD9PIN6_9APIC|nr:bifunctional Pyrophosphate-dependent phosphofructokinase PfpB/ATP-dependent 6-phosphofructokinase/Phosphofructokinase superfamily/Phosphofructokinase domain [Babesia duncani]